MPRMVPVHSGHSGRSGHSGQPLGRNVEMLPWKECRADFMNCVNETSAPAPAVETSGGRLHGHGCFPGPLVSWASLLAKTWWLLAPREGTRVLHHQRW